MRCKQYDDRSDAHLAQGHADEVRIPHSKKAAAPATASLLMSFRGGKAEPGISRFSGAGARTIVRCCASPRNNGVEPQALSNSDSTYSQFTRFSTNAFR